MRPTGTLLTLTICLLLSVDAYADTTGSLTCRDFPVNFALGQEGVKTVECPPFPVFGATLAGVTVPVTVKIDQTAPAISGMPAAGCSMWPANGKLVQVATVTAADAMSGLNAFSVTGASNEPASGKDPDIVITPVSGGGYAVQLRAERLGSGSGQTCTLTATCTVPHDKR